ncbi:MAG: cell division protein FtsH [Dehalococcoides mccartyi]|uniref:ATP-dependent zinc metalloprotease FtsH n=1 Tax=Dehalococcoides mccartyi TaxID=61435 RepID=UPI000150C71F|nr:ATP-dependent zinc metalloprotease FtsH [Dehalococcoides mccartyi]AQU05482.1 cell division protein FtsH [Dehalococcoides mccartyi]AQU06928.1 cell division protein FtsH [Dehalococcoides mccartyi]OBW63004.1 MAG: cell division protein FtsH [Dehalococcoides mccartyi]
MNSNWKRSTIIYVVMLVAIIAIFSFLVPNAQKPEEVPLSQIITLSQEHKIAEITVDSETIEVTTTDGTKLSTVKEYIASIYEIEGLDLTDVKVNIQPAGGLDWGTMILTYLPFLIFGGLLIFIFTQARGANNQAVSFGRSKAKLFNMDKPTITFANVAGVDEAKQEVGEVVEFLKSREKFQALGARIPKGILLIGPPGTGKTLLAKAIAGEAGVPFFSISGSEFVEMFVGVGASRVRDLFDQAKKNAPCIIFIDEIDAVGRQRGAGLGGGHDEREQTLNQILVEMDGFDTDTSVIVVAATNRPDILDPALLRPGRFDRRVVLDKPDITGREAILKIHAKGKPLADTVNLENLGKQTVGFSGADLANLLNEAAILAARKNRKVIETEDLEESIDRVIAGPERKSRRISTQEKEVTAYHETGHGLVLRLVQGADPVHKISIVARGMTLGHTRQLPTEDRYLMTRSQFKGMMAGLLAGYVAEELTFKELSTGASDDLRRATDIAHKMVTSYGMSDKLGPRTFGNKEEMVFLGREISEQKDYGEKIADMIDDEVHGLIEEAHQKARKILTENKNRLKFIAEKLVEKETLEGVELESLFTGELPIAEST